MNSAWMEEALSRLEYDGERLLWRGNATRVAARAGKEAGWLGANGYRYVQFGGKTLLAHRVIWEMVYGKPPVELLDHIDGNRTNNRIANLREADGTINGENHRAPKRGSRSGYLGVSFNDKLGRYVARIHVAGKGRHLGCFDDPAQAYEVYLHAKRSLHKGCTL